MTAPTIKVKIQRRPTIKLKVLPRFPANVTAESPVTLDRTGGSYEFGLSIDDLQESLDPLYYPHRTITGTSGQITVANGSGEAGDPVISVPYTQPVSYPVTGVTSGHAVLFADSDAQFGNVYSQYPLNSVSSNPLIIGKAACTIGSTTIGQTFKIVFTSTGLTGSPITITYTAGAGETTTTIAAGLAALVNANTTLHGTGGKPIFMQSLGSGVFNLQYDSAFSATGATPLTTATTGSTGTITLTSETNALDFIVMQLGRNTAPRAARLGDALYALDFTGVGSTGVFDTHYAQITVSVSAIAQGRGQMTLATAGGYEGYFDKGLTLYNSSGVAVAPQGLGTITLHDDTGLYMGTAGVNRIFRNSGTATLTVDGGTDKVIVSGAGVGINLAPTGTTFTSALGAFVSGTQTPTGGSGISLTGGATPAITARNYTGAASLPLVINATSVALGSAGTLNPLIFANATSGTITLQPVTGALGTVTLSLPAATDTLVGKATTDELTNKTLTSSVGKGTWTASGTWTLPAFTLGGTVSGGGNTVTNTVITNSTIGSATPLSGAFTSLAYSTTLTGTSANAAALAVGRQGATDPAILVDASTATSATGIKIKSAAAAGGVALSAISSGTNENFTIDAKGSGTITLGGTSTGAITLTRATTMSAALTYGGVTLSNAVTGTGNMVLSASPTFTGTVNAGAISAAAVGCTTLTGADNFIITKASGTLSVNLTASASQVQVTYDGSGGAAYFFRDSNAGANLKYFALNSGSGATYFATLSDVGALQGTFINMTHHATAPVVTFPTTTDATSSTAAAVALSGGLAVAKKAYFGDSIFMATAAKTLVLKQGANGCVGTFVANGATAVVVSNSNVAISDTIVFSMNTVGGTPAGSPFLSAISAGTSFSVKAVAGDTSTYNYSIIKNAA